MVGYNLVDLLVVSKVEHNQIEAVVDYNSVEVGIVGMSLVVVVHNNSAESSVVVVYMGEVGNLVVIVVEHMVFVAVDSQFEGGHNHSWMADLNILDWLIHNPSYSVY